MRTRLLFVSALLASAFVVMLLPAAAGAAPPAPTCGPYMTLTPPWGPVGTNVSVNLFQFPPNDNVDIILRVPGNPVVATGTTDEYGHANIMFTMPSFPGDQVAVFAQASPCYAAGAYFQLGVLTTPSPPTPTVPPTETATPPPPTVTVTTTPVPPTPPTQAPVTLTPAAPVAGSAGAAASGLVSGGMNLALMGLALVIFCGAFALWGSTRRLQAERSSKDE